MAMPTYLVTYHGGPGMPADPAAAQQMLAAFQAWVAEVGPAMRDPGAPLAASKTVSADAEVDGQAEVPIGGYTILEAGSLDEAAQLVRSHPFLSRGGSLQVSESVSVGKQSGPARSRAASLPKGPETSALAGKDGSEGTRTRDLRRDRPLRWPRRTTTIVG
jgi:hypothetical protein